MALLGMKGTGDWSTPDERPKNYREQAFKLSWQGLMSPQPFTMILSKLRSSSVTDSRYKIFEDRLPDMAFTVSGDYTNETTITLNALGSTPAAGLKYGDLLTNPLTGEIMRISANPSSPFTSIDVTRQFGSSLQNIASGTKLEWVGSAYGEGTDSPSGISRPFTVVENYTQIFKDSAELTGTAEQIDTRPEKPWPRLKVEALERHMIKMEKAFIFGRRYATTDPVNGKVLQTTGGLVHWITGNVYDYSSTAFNLDALEESCESIFKYGQGEKACFIGNRALTVLHKAIRANSQANWELGGAMNKKQTFGLNVRELITPHGSLMLIPHKLLNESDYYNSWMFIVDTKYAEYVYLRNRDTKFKDNAQNGREDARVGYYLTEAGLRLGLPECHAIIKNVTEYTP